MRKIVLTLATALVALGLSVGCAGTIVVRDAPPPARAETRSPRPTPNAVWIDGHWKWAGARYIWVSGYWEKKPKGTWVAGHWKKTPRGHVWVKGHWKR